MDAVVVHVSEVRSVDDVVEGVYDAFPSSLRNLRHVVWSRQPQERAHAIRLYQRLCFSLDGGQQHVLKERNHVEDELFLQLVAGQSELLPRKDITRGIEPLSIVFHRLALVGGRMRVDDHGGNGVEKCFCSFTHRVMPIDNHNVGPGGKSTGYVT